MLPKRTAECNVRSLGAVGDGETLDTSVGWRLGGTGQPQMNPLDRSFGHGNERLQLHAPQGRGEKGRGGGREGKGRGRGWRRTMTHAELTYPPFPLLCCTPPVGSGDQQGPEAMRRPRGRGGAGAGRLCRRDDPGAVGCDPAGGGGGRAARGGRGKAPAGHGDVPVCAPLVDPQCHKRQDRGPRNPARPGPLLDGQLSPPSPPLPFLPSTSSPSPHPLHPLHPSIPP